MSTLSLHSLFELRTCLQTGTVLLDLESGSLPQIIGETGTPLGSILAVLSKPGTSLALQFLPIYVFCTNPFNFAGSMLPKNSF